MFSIEFIKDEGIFKKGHKMSVSGYVAVGLINKGVAKIEKKEVVKRKAVKKQ